MVAGRHATGVRQQFSDPLGRWALVRTNNTAVSGSGMAPITWRTVARSFTRPYPVTWPMIALMLAVPLYLVIAASVRGRALHAPSLALDRAVPLVPAWALVYGTLYLFLILLPVFVVRVESHIRRMFLTYLTVWITAYACFLIYPTIAPRPPTVTIDSFVTWGLGALYAADPPYNCFPSLHVAHSFVSALACSRVHRGVGWAAGCCAAVVGISTLYTKQHYVLDVIAGALLAYAAYTVLLRRHPVSDIPEVDRRLAPRLAIGTLALAVIVLAGYFVAYRSGVTF